MIFKCTRTKEEVIGLMEQPTFDDNIDYEFSREGEAYYFAVTRIPFQLGKRRPLPYKMWFETGKEGLYLLLEEKTKRNILVAASQDPELYRFFIEKCGCEPVKEVV